MTATYTEFANSRAQTLANTTCFGNNTTTPNIPFYYNEVTMNVADYSSGSCYCSSNNTQSGLVLSANYPDNNAARFEQVVLTFANPVCAPVTFKIWDINQAIYSGDGSHYFTDIVDISATDASNVAISGGSIAVSSCGSNTVTTSGNTKTITGAQGCDCGSHNITISGSTVKSITIKYWNGGSTYSTNPWSQFIIITSIVANPAPTASITFLTINPGGCSASATYTLSPNGSAPNVTIATPSPLTCSTKSVTLTASSITPGVTYAWSGGGSGATKSVSAIGTYSVTATEPGGCSASTSIIVTQDTTSPNVNLSTPVPLNCSITSQTLTASSSTAGVNYAWSGGGGGTTKIVSVAGPYSVTATNSLNNCTSSASTTVVQSANPPNINISNPTPLTCILDSEILTASSSTAGVTFAWSGGTTGATKLVTSAGTYTVTATEPGGCTASSSSIVTQDTTIPNVSINAPPALTCLVSTILLQTSSSTSGATFSWNGGGTGSNKTVSSNGTYTVTATNPANGCTAAASTIVVQNISKPNVTIAPPSMLNCTITSTTLTGASTTISATFAWSGGGTGNTKTVSSAGTYSLTVTDPSNGCVDSTSTTVIKTTSPPNLNIGNALALTCTRLTQTATASSDTAGVTFAWSNGTNTASTTLSTAGPYTVTATNPANGCTVSDTIVVTQNIQIPNVNAGLDTLLNCVQNNIALEATSTTIGATFAWSNGTNTASTNISSANTYTVTATDPNNGCTASDAVIVSQNTTAPNIDAGLDQKLSCINATATLLGSSSTPTVIYSWSGPGTIINGNTISATVNQTGTYTLLATDAMNGCTASDIANVTKNVNAPTADAGLDQILNCTKLSATLTASSSSLGVSFLWSEGSTSPFITVNTPNTYSVTVTDTISGCQGVDVVIVTQNTNTPNVDAGIDTTLNCLITSILLNATSNTANANFLWSNNTSTASTTVTTPNTYSVTVTDPSNGCTASDEVVVLSKGVPILNLTSNDNPCPDAAKGFVSAFVSGGNAPYNYSWSNGAATSIITSLHGGNYVVTVTDANGCSISQSVQIAEGNNLTITNLTTLEVSLGETIQLYPIVTGGTSPLSYTWTPANYLSCSNCSSPLVNTLNNISYTLLVEDTNGCKAESKVTIQVIPDYELYIPNAFTPNGDGSNDFFEIFGNKKTWVEMNIKIFNRWGELVFESSDHNFKWNGTYKGVKLTPGVLVYEMTLTYINGYNIPLQTGSITIIR